MSPGLKSVGETGLWPVPDDSSLEPSLKQQRVVVLDLYLECLESPSVFTLMLGSISYSFMTRAIARDTNPEQSIPIP